MRPLGIAPNFLAIGVVIFGFAVMRVAGGVAALLPDDPHTITGIELYQPQKGVADTMACLAEECTFPMSKLANVALGAELLLPAPTRLTQPAGKGFLFEWSGFSHYKDDRGKWTSGFDPRPSLTSPLEPVFHRFTLPNPVHSGEPGAVPGRIPLKVPHMGMIVGLESADGPSYGIRSAEQSWTGGDLKALENELRRLDVQRTASEEPAPIGPYLSLLYQPVPKQLTLVLPATADDQLDSGTVVALGLGQPSGSLGVAGPASAQAAKGDATTGLVLKGRVVEKQRPAGGRLSVVIDIDERALSAALDDIFKFMQDLDGQGGGPIRLPVRIELSNAKTGLGDSRIVPEAALDRATGAAAAEGSGIVWLMINQAAVPVHVAVLRKMPFAGAGDTPLWLVREQRKPYGLPVLQEHWAEFSHLQRRQLRTYRGKSLLAGQHMLIMEVSPRLRPGLRVRAAGAAP